jgi:LPPG:FO 2-phospho-L-lactate transferase
VHFQEYWVGMHAEVPVRDVVVVGQAEATPAPGVVDALHTADLILLPPSNPIVSLGTILGVPGLGSAVRATAAPVVGVSPVIGGRAVRGMADQLLSGLGIAGTATGVAAHLGARASGGHLDGWLVADTDAAEVASVEALGITSAAAPLLMSDPVATAAMARAVLDLAGGLRT